MRPHPGAIRFRREALKVSLAKLSALTGISESHLSRVEHGKAGLGDENIRRLAAALDATTVDITHEEKP
ncbi:helix-turn-helix domain-containing protein [Streptomyces sp. NPDC056242]|uniref:helix-turn-helix domain-containing protein n=1 Tax=Streptomyces sp. NPDC056242 TaxID=3345760 RepID=UPI0035D87CB9